MELLEHDIAAISIFLSIERLATFHLITGSTKEAILLHQQTLEFGTMLMKVTAVIEIAIRNAICERITNQFGGGGWLRNPPAPFIWDESEKNKIRDAERSARKSIYSKKTQAEKKALDILAYPGGIPADQTHDFISKARQKVIIVSDGRVIAQLTMFFWKRLFSSDYELTLWNKSLKHIFPDKRLKRSNISIHFENIYQARNRVAHHEPIYDRRLDSILIAIDFILKNFGTPDTTGKTPIAKLLEPDIVTLTNEALALKEKIETFRQSANGRLPAAIN